MKRPVAVQLWSVFALAQEDFPGVLRQVSEIGYEARRSWPRTRPWPGTSSSWTAATPT